MMRAARLHGVRDLRVEELPAPELGPDELLVRIEACGICPTDVRKYLLGVNDGEYPFNPGHEWVGVVEAVGERVRSFEPGQRVYGDTYGGYAELAVISTEPGPWSAGPLLLPEELPLERAVFVEPLADCLHAVLDQALVEAGQRVVVVGGGQMGLQLVLAASLAGASVVCAEPRPERRAYALELGAEAAVDAGDWAACGGADSVILSIGAAELVAPALAAVRPGGRVVLFAGFGDAATATLDLNRIHYKEIALVGSEWIGAPPNQSRHRYREALELLASGKAPLERLVSGRCGLDGLLQAFADVQAQRGLKTILVPASDPRLAAGYAGP
jgi:threonine dehydrogenase-like Zn-dependent dehydrogenase